LDIGQGVGEMMRGSMLTVYTIAKIAKLMQDSNANAHEIDGAIGQQKSATSEIAQVLDCVLTESDKVLAAVDVVGKMTDDTACLALAADVAAEHVLSGADMLAAEIATVLAPWHRPVRRWQLEVTPKSPGFAPGKL
jgi:methyl-accepting chemotaxis protein